MALYADIIVPLAQGEFTYEVGESLISSIETGRCVQVQLGRNKHYIGLVWRLHSVRPPYKTLKTIDSYVSNAPMLTPEQMNLWEWMAEYYMCTLGEIMRAALPSALKPEGFSDEEFAKDTYRPPILKFIALHQTINNEESLNKACESLKRAPKQYKALMSFMAQLPEDKLFSGELPRNNIDADSIALKALIKKNIFNLTERELSSGQMPPLPFFLPVLSKSQSDALHQIKTGFETKNVALLHGATGSGKTEIYIHLINEQLERGKNAVLLLPEIAMTTQLIERIRSFFGDRVITYHSRFSERMRVEAYRRVNESKGGELVLGVRSALFLPVNNLGLVIVDEEHDASYKQDDPAPRYNARDCAVILAKLHGAKTLLGSATPSIESYVNAQEGKYALVELNERYGGVQMPQIIISDTIKAVQRGERTVHFNKILTDKISEALAAEEQVMLFQNRRGFSPYVECGECGWTSSCPNCNVTLTLHKAEGKMRCHYCGHSQSVPVECPACNRPAIQPMGFGTEKAEEELAKLFPRAKIERLDRDTAKSMKQYSRIISSFERRETDILVGTQMITKGFDFGGVSLVGILNADNLLNYPDFRVAERAFQIITQVAGRAGRREKQGQVIIQTSQPKNSVILQAASGDYKAMVRTQLAERKEFFYPPYCRLISITLKHRDRQLLWNGANMLNASLRGIFGRRVIGPQAPAVDRVRNEFLLRFLIKIERTASFSKAKSIIFDNLAKMHSEQEFKYITAVCNVDPM